MAESLYRHKFDVLRKWGFLTWEAREIARQYSTTQIITLPYINSLTRWRRLYVSNLKGQGLKDNEIRDRIYALYEKNDWLTGDGVPDVWAMMRRFRKVAIDNGDYIPPARKGSHHPTGRGISKGDLASQRKNKKAREWQSRMDDLERQFIDASNKHDTKLMQEIQRKRDILWNRRSQ